MTAHSQLAAGWHGWISVGKLHKVGLWVLKQNLISDAWIRGSLPALLYRSSLKSSACILFKKEGSVVSSFF